MALKTARLKMVSKFQFEMFEDVNRYMKSFYTLSSGNSACSSAHDMLAVVFPPLSLAALT